MRIVTAIDPANDLQYQTRATNHAGCREEHNWYKDTSNGVNEEASPSKAKIICIFNRGQDEDRPKNTQNQY